MAEMTDAGLDPERIPRHIAVIMDGNGRWARKRELPRLQGHRKGYKTLKNVVNWAADLGVEVLTAYAFSSENWNRPQPEVEGLMQLIEYAARAELDTMKREGVKILTSGRLEALPESVRRQLEETSEQTRDNTRIVLNVAINYGGRNEIVDAARKAARLVLDGELGVEDINEEVFSGLMYHPELPDPDLLIRTAGEMRVSNFLLWETAYTELFVTQALWPDFSREDLVEAVRSYQSRTRKFGRVVEQE